LRRGVDKAFKEEKVDNLLWEEPLQPQEEGKFRVSGNGRHDAET
jgi:hypothetical protein